MRIYRIFGVLAFAGLVLAAQAGHKIPAHAQELIETEHEQLYYSYHKALHTAARCHRVEFTEEEHSAMAQHISGAVNHDIGAKRLRLIGQAKRDAEDQTSGGCTNDNAEESMALFNAELLQYVPRLQ